MDEAGYRRNPPLAWLFCIIGVEGQSEEEQSDRGRARISQYIEQSNFIHHCNFRLCSGISNVPAWGIHIFDSKKDCYQPGWVAGFGSQECCSVLTDSGGVEVRNRQTELSSFGLFGKVSAIVAAGFITLGVTGCLVAGYSSGGGWFVWPGSLGLLLIVVCIIFAVRRR
jgi:hypothetical protein